MRKERVLRVSTLGVHGVRLYQKRVEASRWKQINARVKKITEIFTTHSPLIGLIRDAGSLSRIFPSEKSGDVDSLKGSGLS
jgi:hypothetical protein